MERLCLRIPAAVGLFERGLLAVGWRKHGVEQSLRQPKKTSTTMEQNYYF
jgi:hypothetical protein